MRKTILYFLCLLISQGALAQTFKKVDTRSIQYEGDESFSFSSSFERPNEIGKIEIDVADLAQVIDYDLAKLTALEVLEIKMTEDPEAEDNWKAAVIEEAKKNMQHLAAFKKAPKLKWVIFAVGEQLFFKANEQATPGGNLQRAYSTLGKQAESLLPNVTITAYHWEW
ncbi:MAG: hypothetical protein AAF734_08325 [Bacteroidota bacterium]